jgi:hypothetical protein
LLKKKQFIIYSGIGVLLLIILGVVIFVSNNPLGQLKSAIEKNKYAEAIQIYNQKIKGNLEEEKKTEALIKEELNKIHLRFVANEVDYQQATLSLETILKLELLKPELEQMKMVINKLNDSRIAFMKGQEFIGSSNLKEGIQELKKVITEDGNYAKAQELVSTHIVSYKTTVLKEAEQRAANTDYDAAILALTEALILLPNDSDVTAKKASYEKSNEEKKAAERKKKLEETKANQQVIAEKSGIIVQDDRYKALYPDMIQVIIRNNTEQTVKNLKVSNLAFDANGFPIKIKTQYSFSDGSFEFIGNAENVNIIPKAVFGDKNGWSLDESHGITTVLSCIKEVEYYDGTKWSNPYYDLWLEENKEKPLK